MDNGLTYTYYNNTIFLWLWNFVMYGRIGKHPEQSLLLYSVISSLLPFSSVLDRVIDQ